MRVRRFLWIAVPLVALFLDLASKAWIKHHVLTGWTRPVIPGFFNLVLTTNPGAIFGTMGGAPPMVRHILFLVGGLAALGYFGWEFIKDGTPPVQRLGLGFILGGAMGNGIDRLWHGSVVDFLDFILFGWHYWTFNIADSFIVVGAILIGLSFLSSLRRD
jgi:signal peptidase II